MSHSALASPRSLSRGPLHSLQLRVRGHQAPRCCCCGCLFFSSSFEHLLPFSPVALLLKHKKTYAAVVSVSPVGPILLVEPQPKTVDVDSDVTLNCKWAGNPPLTLTWFKKGSNMVRGQEPALCRFVFPVHSTSLLFLLSIFSSKGKFLSVHANAAIVHRSHYVIQCQLYPVQSRTRIVEHLYCRFLINMRQIFINI